MSNIRIGPDPFPMKLRPVRDWSETTLIHPSAAAPPPAMKAFCPEGLRVFVWVAITDPSVPYTVTVVFADAVALQFLRATPVHLPPRLV